MSKRINVWSSYSLDRLINEQGEEYATQAGGPALFIQCVFEQEDIQFNVNSGKRLDVEILVKSYGEFGRVPDAPPVQNIDAKQSDWAIVSTILDEWRLVEPLPDRLFVDMQGYIRDGSDFGKKQSCKMINRLAGKIFCLKGTKEEINYLSKFALERQKERILLVTDGSREVELFYSGNFRSFPVNKIAGLTDAIGAGDTLLAYFAVSLNRGGSPEAATQYAIKRTETFLRTKSIKKRTAS